MTDPYNPQGNPPQYGQQPSYGQVPYGQAPYGQVPYGQAPYGQAQYGPGPYGYAAPRTAPDAITALVLAIVSFVACPIVASIVALVFARKAEQAIASSGGALTGSGMVTAAKVLAWIEIGLFVASVLFFVVVFAVTATSSSTG